MKKYTLFGNTRFSAPCNTAALVFLTGTVLINLAGAAVTTVGVYDENITDENTSLAGIQNNIVDVSATVNLGNQVHLSTFTTAVQTAFTSNLGGVINFDNGSVTGGGTSTVPIFGSSSVTATYGANQLQSLVITGGADQSWQMGASTNRTAISHPSDGVKGNQLGLAAGPLGSSNSEDFIFNFPLAAQVVMAGGTVLSRIYSGTGTPNAVFNVTATFSNASTSTVSFTSSGSSDGGNDTFAGFKAPDGLFITQLKFDNLNLTGSFRSIDDLGFATVTGITTPIQAWRQTNFGSPANTGNGADDFDADFDGLVNLVEYAFDLNPNQPSVSPVVIVPPSGYLKIQFPRFADRTDIIYNVRASENLSTWTTIASSTGGAAISASGAHSATETGAGTQKTVTVEDAALINSTPKRFLRLEIVR